VYSSSFPVEFKLIYQRPLAPAHAKIWSYSDDIILQILDILGTVLASLLPIASILALYYVSSMEARLGILTGFTALFALCLKLVTGSRKIEVFAATSAYVYPQEISGPSP
jgi:hypothetical protein